MHVQLTVQESRHRLARKIFHGSHGEIRKRYPEGEEDQLALSTLREQGHPVADEDAARLSPLVDAHLNVHGRCTFTH